MAKVKISKKELKEMIKEEYNRKLKEISLKKRLNEIEEEMGEIMSDTDEELDEVKAGGESSVRSTAWTGEKGGDKKFKPEFNKKGSHLVEETDEEEEIEIDIDSDEELVDVPEEEIDTTEEDEMDLDIDEVLSQLANAIEDKIEDTVEDKIGEDNASEEEVVDDTEEIADDTEEIADDTEEVVDDTEESDEEIQEQDGESVAQNQNPKNATPFNNGKANIPKKDALVSESTKTRFQILSGIRKPLDE